MTPFPPLFDIDAAVRARLPDVDHDVAMLHLALMRIGRVVESFLDQTLREDGVDRSEHSVMTALWFAGPPHQLTPTQLSQSVVQTTSGMTKTVNRLERAGLVARTADPNDGRGRLVVLTPAGEKLVARQVERFVSHWNDVLADRSPAKRHQLSAQLWQLLSTIEPAFGHRSSRRDLRASGSRY